MSASVVLLLIAKATVVVGFTMVTGWLARSRRAAIRHLIFAGAFAVLALLPVASALMPGLPLPVPARFPTLPLYVDIPAIPLHPTSEIVVSESEGLSGSRAGHSRSALLTALLPIAWLGGMVGGLVPVVLGLWQIRRVRRQGLPWRDGQTLANDLAQHAGIRRHVDVLVHEAISGPMTCGIVRPVIVFPLDARTWREGDVQRALTHELEHVRRHDWLTLCLARAICAVYWFHPLVWIANRQLCLTAEHACDDAVLRKSQALSYADQLVTLAERSLTQARRPLLAMANRGDLSLRVRAVLNTRQQRGPAGVRARVVVATIAAASIASLAPLQTVAGAFGQAPAVRQFEVASIKPSDGDYRIMNVRALPGRLVADATLQVLMQYAYGVQPFQVVGGPGWLSSARYELEARAGTAATRDEMFRMLQSLLEDRFQLKIHREVRELPVFTLVMNKDGAKLPPPKDGACVDSAVDAAVEWVGGGRMAAPGELPPAKARCGSAVLALGPNGAHMSGQISMSELTRMLSLLSTRAVLDRTEFRAVFDAQLNFVPDETTPGVPPPPPGSGISGVSIAQALQEQLGLRLEPARGPVEMIVVDRAERPSAN